MRVLCAAVVALASHPLSATNWYVRSDGGTRYSTNVSNGQCDGKADAPYPGSGTNKHCAFKDVRYFWSDGSYTYGDKLPGWGWIGAGGDTYLIRGSIGTHVSYRVGANSSSKYCDPNGCWGITSTPGGSGAPSPPSGTPQSHTRILGENYAACRDASAKTQLHGGWGAGTVLSLAGSSYVDVACLDITDFSACGRATQRVGCDQNQDYAQSGIGFSNTSTHDTLTDIHIHGMAANGISGPTGDGVVLDHVDILGNASSGWNTDTGDGSTGKGSLVVRNFNLSWNGCAEEYPVVDSLPYGDCTDQNHGGYGDGFGTTTKDSDPPGWQVEFDHGTVSYNTQDGLDALHIGGKGSSMTVSHTLAFSNMGQQIKVGGATATITDTVIVGNCRAMSEKIPGAPSNYNAKLDLFCRAGDTAILINVPDAQPAIFERNVIYSNNLIGLEIEYPGDPSANAAIKYDNNIFLGFKNAKGEYPAPIYSNTDLKMFTNPGASFNHNTTFHTNSSWRCPARSLHETDGNCSDPHLKDETWHPYGYGDSTPDPAAAGSSNAQQPKKSGNHSRTVAWGGLGAIALVTGVWKSIDWARNRAA